MNSTFLFGVAFAAVMIGLLLMVVVNPSLTKLRDMLAALVSHQSGGGHDVFADMLQSRGLLNINQFKELVELAAQKYNEFYDELVAREGNAVAPTERAAVALQAAKAVRLPTGLAYAELVVDAIVSTADLYKGRDILGLAHVQVTVGEAYEAYEQAYGEHVLPDGAALAH